MDLKNFGIFFLRLGFAIPMAIGHGWSKLMNFKSAMHTFPDPLHIGSTLSLALTVSSELLCAAMIALGLFTRLASIPLIISMSVAFFVVHGPDPFQKKELAFLYLVAFILTFIFGPGKYSLDKIFRSVE